VQSISTFTFMAAPDCILTVGRSIVTTGDTTQATLADPAAA
jgi:hypothetical protein